MGLRGPLVKGKTSIRLNVDGRRDQQSDTITALDENGNRLGDVVFRPSEQTNVTVGIEHALTKDQTLRLEYRRGDNATDNLGVGGFNLARARAYDRNGSQSIRFARRCRGCSARRRSMRLRLQFTQQQQRGGVAVECSRRHRARCVQRRRRRRLEQFVLARARAGRQPRLQRRPQASDARRHSARGRRVQQLRRAEQRGHLHLQRHRWRSTPAGPRRSRSATAR